jgi:WD40 repeat protein
LFDGKADVVDLVLRHYYGACGWGTARFDAGIQCVQYGPGLGDVIAAGADDGRIHFICAQTGEKILSRLSVDGEVWSVDWSPCGNKLSAACNSPFDDSYSVKIFSKEGSTGNLVCQSTLRGHRYAPSLSKECFLSLG